MSATIDPELLELVRGHVSQLSTDVNKMKFENQEEMNDLWLVVKNIEEKLQAEHEKRFENLERAQDVLHQKQRSTAIKVDNLVTNQDVLHHEMDALHQEQSSTDVRLDNVVTDQDIVHHEVDALSQEQSSTAVKVGRLRIRQEAFQQRVTELENHNNCGISFGKYKLDNILLSSFTVFTCISVISNALHYCTGLWELM